MNDNTTEASYDVSKEQNCGTEFKSELLTHVLTYIHFAYSKTVSTVYYPLRIFVAYKQRNTNESLYDIILFHFQNLIEC